MSCQTTDELSRYTGLTLPKPYWIPGNLIVKLRVNLGFNAQTGGKSVARLQALGATGIKVVNDPLAARTLGGSTATVILTFPPSVDLELMKHRAESEPDVLYAEPAYPVELFGMANDPGFKSQSYLYQKQLAEILTLPINHDVIVALIDTGVDASNPDLEGHVIAGKNWVSPNELPTDSHGHGTHLAGIISARNQNKFGVVGLNPRAKLMPLKIVNSTGIGSQIDAAEAIRFAVDNRARIIVCGWGYFIYNQVLKDAVDYALSRGALVVSAAGNQGGSLRQYPAAFAGVIAVGSLDANGNHASFSNVGEHIAFVDDGKDIVGLGLKGTQMSWTGTSQSSAIVAGIASRVLSYNPNLSGTDVRTILMLSAEPIDSVQKSVECGHGRIVSEKLFRALNVPSGNEILGDDGRVVADIVSAPVAEPIWMTVLLIPYRILETGIKFLF